MLADGRTVTYDLLVVAVGIKLDWAGIKGLEATLGRNGVTSNYRYDLAPYTWELVRNLGKGRALFTQPPMPIKCAGAPQKAMYLSCDVWRDNGVLPNIDVEFHNAGARPVRCRGLCPGADGICRTLRHRSAIRVEACRRRW